MKEQATHIRLIRDENGKPVEAEYVNLTLSSETVEWEKFDLWAVANRIPVTGDWPDKEVYEVSEVEEEFQCLESTGWTKALFGIKNKAWYDSHNFETRFALKLRLKAKQECTHEPLIDTGVGYYHCPACNKGWTYSEWEAKQEKPTEEDWKTIEDAKFDKAPYEQEELPTEITVFGQTSKMKVVVTSYSADHWIADYCQLDKKGNPIHAYMYGRGKTEQEAKDNLIAKFKAFKAKQ